MTTVKLSIIYYSATGTNYEMALEAKKAAEAAGAEVRLRKVAELAPDAAIDSNPAWRAHVDATRDVPVATLEDLEWGDAYLFSTPTRYGNVPAQLKQFIDMSGPLWAQGKLSNKVVSAFTSAGNLHGGQETTLMALHNSFYHWGAIIVPPGYTNPLLYASGGNPYGMSRTAGSEFSDAERASVRYQTERMVRIAAQLIRGRE